MPEQYDESVVCLLPLGTVKFRISRGRITSIQWIEPQPETEPQTKLGITLVAALRMYLDDPKYRFDLPLGFDGSDFQQRVWQSLRQIPSGYCITYGQLAQSLGTGARAIGGACRANPLPIVIPCHRVVSRTGIGGYDGDCIGARMAIKERLLLHEGCRT